MFRLLQRLKRIIRVKLRLSRTQSNGVAPPPRFGFKILALILVTGLITAIYPLRISFMPISAPKIGDIATEDLIAPIDFPVEKSPEILRQEIRETVRNVPLVMEFNDFRYDSVMVRLDSLISTAATLQRSRTQLSYKIRQLRLMFPELNESIAREFLSIDSIENTRDALHRSVEDLYYAGVIEDSSVLLDTEHHKVAIIRSGERTNLLRDQVATRADVEQLIARSFDIADTVVSERLGRVVSLLAKPTLSVDHAQTEREMTIAIAQIPREELSFKAGDIILRRNHKVESVHLKWLDALAEYRATTEEHASFWRFIFPVLTRAAFIGFVLTIFAAFLYFFKRREAFTNLHFSAILFLILLQVILNYIVGFKLDLSFYLVPFAISSLLFAILFGLEIGLMATFTLAVTAGILHNFDFSYALVNLTVGSVACFSVRVVRQRSDFYRSILYIAVTYLAVIYLLEYLRFTEPQLMAEEFGYGILNAVLSPILVMGFLPLFESIFNLSTDVTLLELSDMNHPLLRRLAIEAPGTYHHSIVVGNLCEKAAEAIGANPLLARVGAYYHDIGKMEIAEYFIENQSGIKNKHEKLVPSMSALIIGSHIKKGVELAEEFNLPDRIIDFIEEHHGTTLMSYFYNKAKESGEDRELSEDDFRYPGPKPNSRETAIMMLADSVEAASRSLDDPKPSRIRSVIKRIINDKFQAGELSHSALTMHDLGLIEESFASMLIGVFHARIDYPHKEEEE
jgi:putative nucleotidyltransferase with HDIG domain